MGRRRDNKEAADSLNTDPGGLIFSLQRISPVFVPMNKTKDVRPRSGWRPNHLFFAVFTAVLVVAGCQDNGDSAANGGSGAPANAGWGSAGSASDAGAINSGGGAGGAGGAFGEGGSPTGQAGGSAGTTGGAGASDGGSVTDTGEAGRYSGEGGVGGAGSAVDSGVSQDAGADAGGSSVSSFSRILDVEYEQQQSFASCGPTSLAMVLRYHGVEVSSSSLTVELGAVPFGVGRTALRDYVNQNVPGLSAEIVTGWDRLEDEIAAGRPTIAHLGINASDTTRDGAWPVVSGAGIPVSSSFDGGHYVVVVGLVADGTGAVVEVVCNDPSNWQGKYGNDVIYTAASFEQAWDDDYITGRDLHLVAVGPAESS